jgi:hypothetical protein
MECYNLFAVKFLTNKSLFAMLPGAFQADKAKGADTVIQLNVTGAQVGQWNVVIKGGKLNVAKGTHAAYGIDCNGRYHIRPKKRPHGRFSLQKIDG